MAKLRSAVGKDKEAIKLAAKVKEWFDGQNPSSLSDALSSGDEEKILAALHVSRNEMKAFFKDGKDLAKSLAKKYPDLKNISRGFSDPPKSSLQGNEDKKK